MMMLSSLFEAVFPEYQAGVGTPIKMHTTANPPHKDSGLRRLSPPFFAIMGSMTALYGALYCAFANSENGILGLRPSAEFCQNNDNKPCNRPDLFAFQVVSGSSFLVMGGYGFYCWHIKGLHRAIPQTPAGRCFSYVPEAEFIALVCFSFQVWDFFVSLTIEEHRTPIMLMHHTLASAVSFSGLYSQYLLWYGYFFFGLSEVSSIFLVLMDTAKFFPPAEDSSLAAFIGMYCGPMFALTFLFYRGLMWWYVTCIKFSDCYSIIKSGQAEKLRPGKTWVLYVLMGFNLPMGCLQLYWSSLILAEVKKLMDGEA